MPETIDLDLGDYQIGDDEFINASPSTSVQRSRSDPFSQGSQGSQGTDSDYDSPASSIRQSFASKFAKRLQNDADFLWVTDTESSHAADEIRAVYFSWNRLI